jgi:hypothetical protein
VPLKSKPAPGESVPWWASQLYSDPSGRIKYLAIFSDHRSPAITARVHWADPTARIYDLLAGKGGGSAAGPTRLFLRPGEAALWAIVPKAPEKVRLSATRRAEAGCPIRVRVRLSGADREACYGLTLDVQGQWGLSPAHSFTNIQAPGGEAEIEIPTAVNDLPGGYHLMVRESITRLTARTRFTLVAPMEVPRKEELSPFAPRAGEQWPACTMSTEEFLAELRDLRAIYEETHAGLEAKYALSYYLNVPFRPHSRHAILRRLQRVDWGPHLDALAEAIRGGERFYLLAEDTGFDPLTGPRIVPIAYPAAAWEHLRRLPGAQTSFVQGMGGTFEILRLGKGAFVVGRSESVDRAAYHSSDFAAWHEKLKQALRSIAQ